MLHILGNAHYGFFRDELYFIVCGRHPDFGYVDQPPLIPLFAAGSQVFGVSLLALRAVSACFAAAMAGTVSLLAAEFGGGVFAQAAGAFAAVFASILLAFGTTLNPDTAQLWLWPAAILCVARAIRFSPSWFLTAGILLGLSMEAKYSTLFLVCALIAGLALSPQRRVLLSPWLLAGAAAFALLTLPNALWQYAHGWPMLELLRNGQAGKNVVLSPADFLLQQVLLTNPVLAVVWIGGLAWCLLNAAWRWLGFAALLFFTAMIGLHGKAYYTAPLFPALFAAGGVALEWLTRRRPRVRWAAVTVGAVGALALVPLAMPVLPEAQLIAYQRLIHLQPPAMEHHKQAVLGQYFADMHGWPELASQVARIDAALPSSVRDRTRIFASNYGEAAAIDVLAPGLPQVLSGHNQYWLWGPGNWDGAALIDVGGDLEADAKLCTHASVAAHIEGPLMMPYETGAPIILCMGLKEPVSTLWPRVKHYE